MISDVDESLRELIRRDVLLGSKVDVSFDAPTRDWSARRQSPTLNLYLYDIREDLARREVQYVELRDEQGKVTERRVPFRRFKLSYLVTAWTQRPEDEHRLLSAVLACFLSSEAIPPDVLQGGLVTVEEAVRVTIGLPLAQDKSTVDVWTALGGEMKASLDLVVTTPFPPLTPRLFEVGPPVLEEPRIGIVRPDLDPSREAERAGGGRAGEAAGSAGVDAPGGGSAAEVHTAAEGASRRGGGRPRAAVAEVVTEETFQGGADEHSGRRVTIRTLPRRS